MGKKVEICPCCGQKVVAYKHLFNKVLLSDLELLNKVGGVSSLRDIFDTYEMTSSQFANFQKLRYFGLVSKEGNIYSLTPRARAFLDGTGAIPSYAVTKFGELVEEGPYVKIDGSFIPVQTREDFVEQASIDEPENA